MELNGKVALVTGAAQGIGKAITEILLKNGAKVSLLDVNTSVGEATKAAFEQIYGFENILFLSCDVTSENQLEDAFSKTLEKFKRLDIVCNNAGIVDEKDWEKCLTINLVSVIKGTNLGIQHMSKETGGAGGVIVNIASMAGVLPFFIAPVYSASKHGVVGFSRSLAPTSFQKHGIRLQVLCPGFVDTAILSQLKSKQTEALIAEFGLLKTVQIAEAFLQLVMDQTKSGALLKVLKTGSLEYDTYPLDPFSQIQKST